MGSYDYLGQKNMFHNFFFFWGSDLDFFFGGEFLEKMTKITKMSYFVPVHTKKKFSKKSARQFLRRKKIRDFFFEGRKTFFMPKTKIKKQKNLKKISDFLFFFMTNFFLVKMEKI